MPVVLVEKQTPQITLITLNRPERRNALTIELLTELTAAIEKAAADEIQRVLILRGALCCYSFKALPHAWEAFRHVAKIVARDAHNLHMVQRRASCGAHSAAQQADLPEIISARQIRQHKLSARIYL